MTHALLSTFTIAALGQPAVAQRPAAETVAIVNATIVPVVGSRIERGTIVITAGKIAAVGATVAVPATARRIDAAGLFVYPGLIDAGTRLGLTEVGSVPGPEDTQELGSFNPHNLALTAVNPHSDLIPVTRANGITTAITSARGGLIQGYAALIDLDGWTPDEMGVAPRAAMVMTYPRIAGGRGRFRGGQAEAGDPGEAMNRQVRELSSYLKEAKAFATLATRERANLPFQALWPVLAGEVPALFDVQTAGQIRGVLSLADSLGLRVILRGASEAWMLADTLAARRIPVIVGPLTQTPDGDQPYDAVYGNPGVLAAAGVMIAFQSDDAAESRNLPYNAALATAYGLSSEEALKALTINPATIFGVADRIGSIEVGKVANLQITTGDPLDARTQIRHVFIRGLEQPMADRHSKLYHQFRARPKG
ncbi:MAG: amidohydrolase family protein [Gemmatimonadales bacterium]